METVTALRNSEHSTKYSRMSYVFRDKYVRDMLLHHLYYFTCNFVVVTLPLMATKKIISHALTL